MACAASADRRDISTWPGEHGQQGLLGKLLRQCHSRSNHRELVLLQEQPLDRIGNYIALNAECSVSASKCRTNREVATVLYSLVAVALIVSDRALFGASSRNFLAAETLV
jgi:hypothetical protein